MKTSYYARLKTIDTKKYVPIAISGDEGKIVGFEGLAQRRLSPYTFFRKWKERETEIEKLKDAIGEEEYQKLKGENQNDYIEKFYAKVLKNLNPVEVYDSLGENAVLLCFEKPTQFCHRFLVAAWLELKLGVKIDELGFENDKAVQENKTRLKQKLEKVINKYLEKK